MRSTHAEQLAAEVSDAELAAKVKAALDQDPELAKLHLKVTNKKGDITIDGTMTDDQQMLKAGEITQNVPGVKNVLNNMMMTK
ncbi:BON domain-containing protein [Crenobacter sp. SG2303]|uniref:BON domain-containing protein n=1 Tax=Crenobacter oryzisoli TaxID=3056844 RepID=A0ABT7XSU7_9NEIS|nr:BON domain-containing protein [Crenobacter sp. SG2303]MDN0076795.1 BON domain-containing protein [Crenobacter sp. SG2303]